MLRVCFYCADQNPHRDRTLGISVYTRNLFEQLSARPEIRIEALASKSSLRPEIDGVALHTLPLRTDGPIGRLAFDQLHPFMGKFDVDLWHYPKGFLPLLFQPSQPIVGTVHDVILQFYADHYPRARSATAYRYWLTMLRRSIPRFARILTMSQFSKARIQQFCERHRLRCPPIDVTKLACRWHQSNDPRPAKENYVLHLASKELHKRTATLLEFWGHLEKKRQDLPALHLVGQLNADAERLLSSLHNVRLLPRLEAGELRRKFLRARALIFPSEIEGFGLPALEAYEMRTPVVFASGTPVRELLGIDAEGEFDLQSVESFEAALDSVLALEASQIENRAAKLHRQFSWERCANETVAAYRAVMH